MTKQTDTRFSPEVQVSNILRWALPLRDKMLVQFRDDHGPDWQKYGYRQQLEWREGLCLNPIMENAGDCGISGEELHRRYRGDRIAAEVHIQRVVDRREKQLVIKNVAGRFEVRTPDYVGSRLVGEFATEAEAVAGRRAFAENERDTMRIVSVLDDALMQTLHGFACPAPTVGEWLATNNFTPDTFPLVPFAECAAICAPKPKRKAKPALAEHITDGYESCQNCGYPIRRGMKLNDDTPEGLICGKCCRERGLEPTAKAVMDTD